MKRGKIFIWISTGHDVLPESTTVHEPGYAYCWVPSKAGAAFRIGYSAIACGYGLKVSVYIDGELAAEQTHIAPRGRRLALTDGIRSRKDGIVLSPENDLDIVSDARLPQLGSIKVKFSWIIVDRSSLSARPCARLRDPTSHHQPVFEGLVKRRAGAIAHAAGLGASRRISPNWVSEKYTILRNESIKGTLRPLRWRETRLFSTTFEFKYAPSEYLSAENILRCPIDTSTPQPNRESTNGSPWRSHVGTPYRELRANTSLTAIAHVRASPHNNWFSLGTGLDFNTPVKLGSHTVTNLTPLAKIGSHTIMHPIKMGSLVKVTPPVKEEPNYGCADESVVEISAQEFYRREVIDLTAIDSD
ncbi:hypothetical protein CTheo_4608 [Ceratobasidium theobromae]|uniref:Uncharacterized protein n=1 Tax=Ceratobasidium theobromae TaxID=1582974 RepID=A0A5N5QJL4_9AGAM|nr:hypothetical protein CTheo_4608 [Ceratobasidium theobromae]